MAVGAAALIFSNFFDLCSSFSFEELMYVSRLPRPIQSYGNITLPLSPTIWAVSASLIGILSLYFLIAHSFYQTEGMKEFKLAQKEESRINFFLFSYVKLTEPDPLPWFRRWSSGRFGVLLWTVLSFFMVMFYTSNLRAHMVTIDYEKPLKTLQDIAENGKRVYVADVAFNHR